MRVLVVIAVVLGAASANNFFRLSSPYSYSCLDSLCVRKERGEVREHLSLTTCQLTCGQYGALWPQPTGNVQMSKKTVNFNPENMQVTKMAVTDQEVSKMLEEATRYFERNIHFLHPEFPKTHKTPYTDQEKVPITQGSPQLNGIISQRRTPFIQQNQQQANPDIVLEPTIENWKTYSPFLRQKYNRPIQQQKINLEFTVNTPERKLNLGTNEGYDIDIKTVADETTVKIQAQTYFGARHALETLSQLIAFDETTNTLQIISDATIQDTPQFKYRGFMLDTSRNFYTKEELMTLIDSMSQNKMNYFHWHITDSASFPLYTSSRPEMSYYGAYSPRKVYYPEDIREITQYAKLRGISVVPEINGPGHSAAGWQWGEKSGKGKLVLCTDTEQPWFEVGKEPPSGQLNPVNPEVYNVLAEIYKDMVDYFDPELVHMGGDDVSFKCWGSAVEIKEYFAANNREVNSQEMFELWNVYQNSALAKLQESSKSPNHLVTPIIYSSSFARNFIDKNRYIIQVTENANDPAIAQYVKDGYKVIFSNLDQWRLDCLGSTWYGEKSQNCPQHIPTTENFYKNSPLDMLTTLGIPNTRADSQNQQQSQILENVLGGTATLYSSETDGNGLQPKVWPRVSAMAERLWSDPTLPLQGTDTTQKRMNIQRQRMVARGIRADSLQPEYCMRDESACFSQEEYTARSANIPQ